MKKRGFFYINFLISPHELISYKILVDDQQKRTRQALDLFPPGWEKGGDVGVSTWPQSPFLPKKLAMALKNKTSTLHSAIHMYHRCLTINSVFTLTLIVSNQLYFTEYTSSYISFFIHSLV